jgi:hypothetical protein
MDRGRLLTLGLLGSSALGRPPLCGVRARPVVVVIRKGGGLCRRGSGFADVSAGRDRLQKSSGDVGSRSSSRLNTEAQRVDLARREEPPRGGPALRTKGCREPDQVGVAPEEGPGNHLVKVARRWKAVRVGQARDLHGCRVDRPRPRRRASSLETRGPPPARRRIVRGTASLGRHGKRTSVSRLRQESHTGSSMRASGAEVGPPQRSAAA